jgi:hypothetical protein
MATIIAC